MGSIYHRVMLGVRLGLRPFVGPASRVLLMICEEGGEDLDSLWVGRGWW